LCSLPERQNGRSHTNRREKHGAMAATLYRAALASGSVDLSRLRGDTSADTDIR